jgi:hypothetical protein
MAVMKLFFVEPDFGAVALKANLLVSAYRLMNRWGEIFHRFNRKITTILCRVQYKYGTAIARNFPSSEQKSSLTGTLQYFFYSQN